jgi:hypothetical protein
MADTNEMDLVYGGFLVSKRVLAGVPIGHEEILAGGAVPDGPQG